VTPPKTVSTDLQARDPVDMYVPSPDLVAGQSTSWVVDLLVEQLGIIRDTVPAATDVGELTERCLVLARDLKRRVNTL